MQPLVQRMPAGRASSSPTSSRCRPSSQIGLHPGGQRGEPPLLQPRRPAARANGCRRTRQARNPRHSANASPSSTAARVRCRGQRGHPLPGQPLEAAQVHHVRVELEQVTRSPPEDLDARTGRLRGLEHLPQPRNIRLHHVDGTDRRLLPHSPSTRKSVDTTRFTASTNIASTARCLVPPSSSGTPESRTSSRPRIRTSTRPAPIPPWPAKPHYRRTDHRLPEARLAAFPNGGSGSAGARGGHWAGNPARPQDTPARLF